MISVYFFVTFFLFTTAFAQDAQKYGAMPGARPALPRNLAKALQKYARCEYCQARVASAAQNLPKVLWFLGRRSRKPGLA